MRLASMSKLGNITISSKKKLTYPISQINEHFVVLVSHTCSNISAKNIPKTNKQSKKRLLPKRSYKLQ